MLKRMDHVAIAVADLEASIQHYQRVWGLTLTHREVVASQGVEEAMFRIGDTFLQLVAPLAADTPVGRFLERRGEGLHHIAYEVDHIEDALAEAAAHQLPLVDTQPRDGGRNTRIAFLRPKANQGVLVELVELGGAAPPDPRSPDPRSPDPLS